MVHYVLGDIVTEISERENNVDFTDLALTMNSPSTVK